MYDSGRPEGLRGRGAPAARGATGGSPQDGAASRGARLGTVRAQNPEPLPEERRARPPHQALELGKTCSSDAIPAHGQLRTPRGCACVVRRAETRRYQKGRAGTHRAGAVRRLPPGAAPPPASDAPSFLLRRGGRGGLPAPRASGAPASRPPSAADAVFSFHARLFSFHFICFYSLFSCRSHPSAAPLPRARHHLFFLFYFSSGGVAMWTCSTR